MNQIPQFTPDTYTASLENETWREFACRAENQDELISWQKAFRPRLKAALGISAVEERGNCALNPEREEYEEFDDHIRELWTIASEPGYRIPFYLLRPRSQEEPLPLILAPHGHGKGHLPYIGVWESAEDKENALGGDRDIGLQAVRNGYIAIVPILRGYHRMSVQSWGKNNPGRNTCETQQKLALLFGRTLIGERCHDLMRIIDYVIEARNDVQKELIAVTGNSGGGTMSLFLAAIDQRVKISIPGSYYCTFAASLGSVHHCGCNFIPGIMRLGEMYDVAGLIAPRPFLAVNGKDDPIFPVDATRKAFAELQQIYKTAGAEDRCELFIGHEGHRYYKEPVWPFVKKWMKNYQNETKHK